MARSSVSTVSIVVRLVADAVMAGAALFIALFVRLLTRAGVEGGGGPALLAEVGRTFVAHLPVVVGMTLVVFSAWGVYGRLRRRDPPGKLLELVGAVTLVWVLIGVLEPLLPDGRSLAAPELLTAWAAAMVFTLASRTWATTWRFLAAREAGQEGAAAVSAERAPSKAAPRVLVIGGAGYIGSALLPKLLDAGYRVRLLDRLLFGEGPIRGVLGRPGFELVRADFRQVDRVVAAMEKVDAVVHLGGLVGDPSCDVDHGLTTEVNLDFTRVLAEVAKGHGVERFVFASSCSVYGASDELLDESSLLNPVSLYGRSKIASENVLFEMADERFAPTMLRFGTVYGLSGRPRFDLVVNLLAAKAVRDGKITVFGGDQWRPFVHAQDAARAVVLVLQAPIAEIRNEIFNVGSDEQNATLGDIGHLIQRLVPQAEYIDSGSDEDRRNYRVDFRKIRETLGFTPEWSLDAGVRQVVEALRSGAIGDYRDPLYSNARFLKEGDASRYMRVRHDWATQRITGDVSHSSKAVADARARPNPSETGRSRDRASEAKLAGSWASDGSGVDDAGQARAGELDETANRGFGAYGRRGRRKVRG
jgi:nucleoside-diphosphate-sugar epimerase